MLECGQPTTPAVQDRINYYKRYAALLGTTPDANLDCANQVPYGSVGDGSSGGTGSDPSGCAPADAACVCTSPSPRSGRLADQSSGCAKYYDCSTPGAYFRGDCPVGMQFSNSLQICDQPGARGARGAKVSSAGRGGLVPGVQQ